MIALGEFERIRDEDVVDHIKLQAAAFARKDRKIINKLSLNSWCSVIRTREGEREMWQKMKILRHDYTEERDSEIHRIFRSKM
jgi:hypothetical protein